MRRLVDIEPDPDPDEPEGRWHSSLKYEQAAIMAELHKLKSEWLAEPVEFREEMLAARRLRIKLEECRARRKPQADTPAPGSGRPMTPEEIARLGW